MMTEISLNVLDVAENSTRAKASLVTITVHADFPEDRLSVIFEDDGCGMTPERQVQYNDSLKDRLHLLFKVEKESLPPQR